MKHKHLTRNDNWNIYTFTQNRNNDVITHILARLTNDLSKSIDIKAHKLARIIKKFKWMEIKPVYLDRLRFENVKNR